MLVGFLEITTKSFAGDRTYFLKSFLFFESVKRLIMSWYESSTLMLAIRIVRAIRVLYVLGINRVGARS